MNDEKDFIRIRIGGAEAVIYPSVQGVIGFHASHMGCTREQARNLLRSPEGLESAVMRPRNVALYEEDADIPLQAAYLAHGIAEGQHFLDGNKRTALVTMEVFLNMNGIELTADDDTLVDWMLSLSRGASVYDLAKQIQDNCRSVWDR
jgi:death-on-curing protein